MEKININIKIDLEKNEIVITVPRDLSNQKTIMCLKKVIEIYERKIKESDKKC